MPSVFYSSPVFNTGCYVTDFEAFPFFSTDISNGTVVAVLLLSITVFEDLH